MSVTTRRLAALAAPVVLVGALSACGGGGAPTDASPEAFCDAFNGPVEDLVASATEEGEEPPSADIAAALKTQVGELEETGTPEDIPEDARSGFEVYVEQIQDLDEDEMAEAIESGDDDDLVDVTEDEDENVDTFNEYAAETCGSPGL